MLKKSKLVLFGFAALTLCACTYSVSLVHTEGEASDVIDQDQSPDVSPSLEVPLKPGL